MIPAHSPGGGVLFTKITFPFIAFFAVLGLGEAVAAAGKLLVEEDGDEEDEEEVEDEAAMGAEACTDLANSFTNFLSPCTLSEVPMMMSKSGLRARSADSMRPISSP